MPAITLTPTACTEAAGWRTLYYYLTTNSSYYPRQLIFTYPTSEVLGGAGINITEIVIRGYVRNSSSVSKRLRMGCKPSASAAVNSWSTYGGSNVLDGAFTAAGASNGSYKYTEVSRVLSGDALARFAGYMRERFAAGQPVYLGVIQPDDGRSIQVNPELGRWTIAITYELLGNVPSTSVNSAVLGSTAIKTTLSKVVGGSTTTLRYKIGSTVLAEQNLGTGTSRTYTVPTSAGQHFPDTPTATLTIEAETFVGSTSYGTVSTSVTLTLPSDAAPTAACTVSRTWVSGVASSARIAAYVQSKSGASFALTGTAKYGASVASFRLTIDGKTYTRTGNGSISHSPISGSGTVSYTYTVIDSRGLSRVYTGTLTVLEWSTPKITGFKVARVTSGNVEDIGGTYVRATVQGSVSSLVVGGSQKNSIKYNVQYREIAAEGEAENPWANTDTLSFSATSVNNSAMLKVGGEPDGGISDLSGYEFRLRLSDIYATSTALDELPTKDVLMDIDEATGNIGFGGSAPGASEDVGYRFHQPVDMLYGARRYMTYSTQETDTGMRWYNGKAIYCRVFTGTSLTNNGGTDVGTITGINALVAVQGYALADTGARFPVNFAYHNNPQQMLSVNVQASGAVRVFKGDAWTAQSYEIAILYTKAAG